MWGTSDLMQASVEHRLNEDWKLYAAYSYNTETFSANQLRITAVNPVTGIVTRSNDGTQGSLSNVSYGTSYLQGGFWLGGMRNEVLFGGDAQYRTIYRKDLIRQATPNVFNIYNPVYGLLQPGTTVSASRQRPDRQARHPVAVLPGHAASDRPASRWSAACATWNTNSWPGGTAVHRQHQSRGRQGAAARRRHPQAHRTRSRSTRAIRSR